jgi:hypothetical protein
MEIPPDLRPLATAFVKADRIEMKARINFKQMRAMARKASEVWDDAAEFRADCEAELAAEMFPGQRVEFGDKVLVRVDVDGFPAIAIENAVGEGRVA